MGSRDRQLDNWISGYLHLQHLSKSAAFMASDPDTPQLEAIAACTELPDLQLLLEALHAAVIAGDAEAACMLQLLRGSLH